MYTNERVGELKGRDRLSSAVLLLRRSNCHFSSENPRLSLLSTFYRFLKSIPPFGVFGIWYLAIRSVSVPVNASQPLALANSNLFFRRFSSVPLRFALLNRLQFRDNIPTRFSNTFPKKGWTSETTL